MILCKQVLTIAVTSVCCMQLTTAIQLQVTTAVNLIRFVFLTLLLNSYRKIIYLAYYLANIILNNGNVP